MKRVFLGIATVLIGAHSVWAGPFYDAIGGGATTFGGGVTYSTAVGRMVNSNEIYVRDTNCLRVTFSALSNDVQAMLICQGNLQVGDNLAGAITLDMQAVEDGFCLLHVDVIDAAPVSDDYDILVQREASGHAICP